MPTSGRERAFKSDASDCRKLARSLENGELRGIDVPPVGLVSSALAGGFFITESPR